MEGSVSLDALTRALDAGPDGFALVRIRDGVTAVEYLNAAASAMARKGEHVGRPVPDIVEPDIAAALVALVTQAASRGRVTRRVHVAAGRWAGSYDVAATPLDDAGPDGLLVVLTWRDVTDEASMRTLLQTALDSTSDSFAVYRLHRDSAGEVVGSELRVINLAGATPLGRTSAELVGQDLREFFPPAVETGLWDAMIEAARTQQIRHHRVDMHGADGTWIASFDNTLAPSADDMMVVTWRDVSDAARRSRELADLNARVTHEATHDPLTGLANRSLLLRRMEEALVMRRPRARVGLVFIDVDHFKRVNDQHGHLAGDRLLKSIAGTLLSLARSTDCVARLGGDEFVVLLPDLPEEWSADAFLGRVLSRLNTPVLLDSAYVTPSASLGLVLCPPAEPDIASLLRRADAAMYASKRAGRGRATVD